MYVAIAIDKRQKKWYTLLCSANSEVFIFQSHHPPTSLVPFPLIRQALPATFSNTFRFASLEKAIWGRLIYLPVAQLDSARDSAFRRRRNIAMRGDDTSDCTAPGNSIKFLPERQTLKGLFFRVILIHQLCWSLFPPHPSGFACHLLQHVSLCFTGEGLYIYLWHSWIARQTPTLKVRGSNPRR